MLVIHINNTTQQFIADTFNEGIVPVLGKDDPAANGEDTYYLVTDGAENPNLIVTSEVYYDEYYDENNEMINIIKK